MSIALSLYPDPLLSQVNHRGGVYEKDLGPQTATLARQMKAFNPDKMWKAVEGE